MFIDVKAKLRQDCSILFPDGASLFVSSILKTVLSMGVPERKEWHFSFQNYWKNCEHAGSSVIWYEQKI